MILIHVWPLRPAEGTIEMRRRQNEREEETLVLRIIFFPDKWEENSHKKAHPSLSHFDSFHEDAKLGAATLACELERANQKNHRKDNLRSHITNPRILPLKQKCFLWVFGTGNQKYNLHAVLASNGWQETIACFWFLDASSKCHLKKWRELGYLVTIVRNGLTPPG